MNALQSFTFEGRALRVFGDAINPIFIAADVCKIIGIQNPTDAIKSLASFERTKVVVDGREINAVNESGLYTLILRSRDAVKEGTPAYRFRLKVTAEILPAIRRSGRYEAPKPEYISVEHRWAIQKAVGRKARGQSVNYQTVYRALKDHFKVEKYTHILEADFDAAIAFIESLPPMELPPESKPAPKLPPAALQKESRKFLVDERYVERQRTFIYCVRYLFREELDLFIDFMHRVDSPRAGQFWEAVHGMHLSAAERDLAKLGYDVKELDCYKSWASQQPKRLTA